MSIHRKRSCACSSPAIRLHRTPDVAADLFALAWIAGGVVPYRGAIADPSLYRHRGGGPSGVDPVRADLRRSGDLEDAFIMPPIATRPGFLETTTSDLCNIPRPNQACRCA